MDSAQRHREVGRPKGLPTLPRKCIVRVLRVRATFIRSRVASVLRRL